ncbi:YadA-like family protein [Sneathia vaginalis]|uniref:YadA-like family protein n=1 Tax=Sneathia vaginalis TaxID=187101 RepID=UPI0035C72120
MKNEALKFLKKICKNRVKVTKRMVIFFLMTGGLLLSQVNFSETVDETKPATIKDLKDYTSEEVGKVKKEIEGLKEETIENLKNYDYPNSLHFVSVQYSEDDVKEYKDYYKYLDLLKERLEYLKEMALEEANGKDKKKIREINKKAGNVKKQMDKLKETNKLISQKVTNEIEGKFKPKNSDKDKKIEEINKEYTERIDKINKLGTNFNNLGIDFAHSIAIGKGAEIKGENGIAIGVDTLSGKDSISLGKDAIADGEGNIAIGRDATLFSKTFKSKVGQEIARILKTPDTIVKFENEGDVEYKKSIAIGDGTKSSGNSNIAIGDNAVAMKKRLTLISLQDGGTLSNKNGAEIEARNWNDIAKQFYKPDDDDKRNYKFEVKPVENAIALGKNASAFANNVIAIGKGAISGFESAVSIGENADTEGENSVAIGKNSKIFGESSVAIGEGSRTGKIKYVLKTIDGKDKVENSEEFDTIEAAKQELKNKNDLSKIYRIEVGGEKSENSVAIGKNSAVEYKGSVAIGADSLAVKSNGKSAFTEVDHTSGETVSFGKEDRKRRLTNVADGSADSDAVTVAQLKKAIDGNKGGSGGQLNTGLDKKLDKTTYEKDKPTFATKKELETSKVSVKEGEGIKVTSTNNEYTVALTDGLKTKIDGALQSSVAETTYAKKDASNITEANWITKLGDADIENGTKLAKSSAVKTYLDNKLGSITNQYTELTTKVENKLDKTDVDVTGDNTYIQVEGNQNNKKNNYKISLKTDKLKEYINSNVDLSSKADKNAGNIEVDSWATKLGTGEVAENNTNLVTGGKVYNAIKNSKTKVQSEGDIITVTPSPETDTGINGVTYKIGIDATKLNKKINASKVSVKEGEGIKVTSTGNEYTVALADGLKTKIDGALQSNEADGKYAKLDASNITEANWVTKLGDADIENGTKLAKSSAVKTYVNNKINNITTTVSGKLSSDDVDVTGDNTYIQVDNNQNGKKNNYKISLKTDKLKEYINSNVDLSSKADKNAGNIEVNSWATKLGTGEVAENNTNLVTGGKVYNAIKNSKTKVQSEGDIITVTPSPETDTGINGVTYKIGIDATKLNEKINASKVSVKEGEGIKVTPTGNEYTVALADGLKTKIEGALQSNEADGKYAKLDASNLDEKDITTWQEKLGNGAVTDGDTKLVKGGTVFTYVDNTINTIKQELFTKSNQDLAKKLDIDAKNITTDGVATLTTKLGTGAIEDNNNNLVTGGTVKKYITDEINDISNKVSGKLSSSDVDVKGDDYITVNKDTIKRNYYSLVFDKDKLATDLDLSKNTKLTEQFNKYALLDGSNLDSINLNVWQAKLGNGTITNGNTGLVKGGDIYNYMTTFKQELTNKSTQDLSNKLDKDGTNLDETSLVKLTNKLSEGSNLTTPTNRLVTDTKVSEALKGKLNVDADNLSENGVATLTTKLGKGEVKEGDTGLITGGKVYEVKDELNKKINTNTTDINNLKTTVNDLKNTDITNINTKLGNIDKSITNINTKLDDKLDKSDLSIKGDDYIKVENTNFNYKLSLNKDTLAKDIDLTNNTSVNNMFTNKLGNINTNIGDLKNEVENNKDSINKLTTKVDNNTNDITNLKQDITKKLDADANNLSADGITNLTNKLSKDSNIAKPKDRLVTDKQVNKYLSRYNDALGVVDKKSTVALEKSELALGGVANAVAMANLVQVNSYSDYRHNLSAAYGYYGGSHALAVGFSGTNEERNFVYKLSGSVNNKGNLAFGVGAGVMLGDKDERLTTEYSTKLKSVEKDLVEANKKIKEYEERQKATDIKVKELERKLNQILNKH